MIVKYELQAEESAVILRCVLAAGSEVNLNPALLTGALGVPAAEITRLRLLREDGTDWE